MTKRSKEEQMRANLEEVGIKEEEYWRFLVRHVQRERSGVQPRASDSIEEVRKYA